MKKIIICLMISFAVMSAFCETYEEFVSLIKDKSNLEKIIWIDKKLAKDKDSRYYKLKANIELKLGDFRGAKKTLTVAAKHSDDDEIKKMLGIVCYNLKDYSAAGELFSEVLANNENDSTAKLYMYLIEPFATNSASTSGMSNSKMSLANKMTEVDFEQLKTLYNEEIESKTSRELPSKSGMKSLYKEEIESTANSDFVYMLNERCVEVVNRSKFNYLVHFVIKVRSATAVSVFKDFSYSYNGYEFTPQIVKAGTYTDGGEFVAVDAKNVVNVDNQKNSSHSMYSNRKTLIFPFPDIDQESIVEVAIQFNATGKTLSPKIFDDFAMFNNIPTMMYRYTIVSPKDLSINIVRKGENVIETDEDFGSTVVKRYIFNPTAEDFANKPKIALTCYDGWDDVASWYNDIFYKMLSATDNKLADEIISNLSVSGKSKYEQIDAVYKFIKKNIRYVGIELAENAILPRNPEQIYKNKFGDCKDQVVLMLYLLNRLNIDAEVSLLATGNSILDKDVASPLYFNHVITHIPVQNGLEQELYLDTTSTKLSIDNLPSIDQDQPTLLIAKNGKYEFAQTPIIDYTKNKIVEEFNADVSIIGSGTVNYHETFTGAFADIISESFAGKTQDQIVGYLYSTQKETYPNLQKENILVSGLETESDRVEINITSDEKNVVSLFFDGRMKIKYSAQEVINSANVTTDPNRDYSRGFLCCYSRKVKYKLPDNYKIVDGTVKNIFKQNEYISLEFMADKIDSNTYTFDCEFIAKKRNIPQQFVLPTQKLIAEFLALTSVELTFENKVDFDNEKFFDALLDEYEYKDIYEKYIGYLNNSKKYEKALEVCDRATAKFNSDSYFALVKSSLLFQMERYEEDEVLLRDLLEAATAKNNKDDMLDIYYYLIALYKRTGNDAKFESTLLDALSHFSEDRALIGEATSFYCRMQQYDKAIEVLNNALQNDSTNAGYYSDLGYVYSMVPDFEKAKNALENAIKYDEKNHNAMNNLAWLYCENDTNLEEALSLAKRAVELEPLNDSYLDTLGEVYFKLKQYSEARDAIKKALGINPNSYLQHQLDKVEQAMRDDSGENVPIDQTKTE